MVSQPRCATHLPSQAQKSHHLRLPLPPLASSSVSSAGLFKPESVQTEVTCRRLVRLVAFLKKSAPALFATSINGPPSASTPTRAHPLSHLASKYPLSS